MFGKWAPIPIAPRSQAKIKETFQSSSEPTPLVLFQIHSHHRLLRSSNCTISRRLVAREDNQHFGVLIANWSDHPETIVKEQVVAIVKLPPQQIFESYMRTSDILGISTPPEEAKHSTTQTPTLPHLMLTHQKPVTRTTQSNSAGFTCYITALF